MGRGCLAVKFDLNKLVERSTGLSEVDHVAKYENIDLRETKKVMLDETTIARDIYKGIIKPVDDATGEHDVIHRQLVYTVGMMALGLVPDLGDRVVAKLGENITKLKKRRTDLFIGATWKTQIVQAIFESWVEGMKGRL